MKFTPRPSHLSGSYGPDHSVKFAAVDAKVDVGERGRLGVEEGNVFELDVAVAVAIVGSNYGRGLLLLLVVLPLALLSPPPSPPPLALFLLLVLPLLLLIDSPTKRGVLDDNLLGAPLSSFPTNDVVGKFGELEKEVDPAHCDFGLDVLKESHGHKGEGEPHDVEEGDGSEGLGGVEGLTGRGSVDGEDDDGQNDGCGKHNH